ARCVDGLHGDVAEGDLVAVVQAGGVELVLPVGAALAGDVSLRPGGRGQFACAGEVVGVDVGLGDGGDGHVVRGRQVEVLADVAPGVDDERLALGLAADEVSGLGQVFVIDPFEKHRVLLGTGAGLSSVTVRWIGSVLDNTYPGGYPQHAAPGICREVGP